MNLVEPVGLNLVAASSRYLVYNCCPRQWDNFTDKFGCRLTVKNGVAVVKNSLRSW